MGNEHSSAAVTATLAFVGARLSFHALQDGMVEPNPRETKIPGAIGDIGLGRYMSLFTTALSTFTRSVMAYDQHIAR